MTTTERAPARNRHPHTATDAVTAAIGEVSPSPEPVGVRVVHGTQRALGAIQDDLPASNWPAYLTAGALAFAGVVEWPTAIGGTVLYLVFKHWPFGARR